VSKNDRDPMFSFRMPEMEIRWITRLAKKAGFSRSEWARHALLLRAARVERAEAKKRDSR